MANYCVIGAGAAGLSALDVLTEPGPPGRLLREERPGRRSLEHRLRRPAPDHVSGPDPLRGLPDAGRVPALPAAGPDPRLHRLLRPDPRSRSAGVVRHRGALGSAGRDRRAGRFGRLDGHHLRRVPPPTTVSWWPTATCGTPRSPRSPGTFAGPQIHSSQVPEHRRHRGQPGAGRRGRQLRLRSGRGRRPAPLRGRHRRPARGVLPAEDVLRPAAPAVVVHVRIQSGRPGSDRPAAGPGLHRPELRLPRTAGADPRPAGRRSGRGQRPAALLDPSRPGECRRPRHHRPSTATRVHFADRSSREYDTILWATGFRSTLPFLDDGLVPRRGGHPLRYAGGIVPHGLEKLYYIGLSAPRGPQIPVYGVQAKLAERMIRLHEQAGPGGAGVAAYFARLQEADDRVDIPRDIWTAQIADTERLLDAYVRQPSRRSGGSRPTTTWSSPTADRYTARPTANSCRPRVRRWRCARSASRLRRQ